MATTVARLQAVLTADTRDFSRGMDKADRDVGRLGGSAKKGFGLVSKLALGAGAAIATGLGVTAKIGWDEMVQGQKVAAQTNAVLKSTGRVAGVTAKDVARLSESIMKKTGIDDEAVASGQNLLLTFTNIRNETGKGNDIFTQSTRIMTDMSVALGQDMKSSAIQLGKALNDPIKGVTALRRVGVSFTEAQIEQIKSLEATGKHMQAQKLILKELNTEFGGSAEAAGKTLPGQLAILRESFNNWAGDMVSKALPVLMDFVTWVQDKAVPAIRAFVAQMSEKLKPAFEAVRNTAAAVWPIVKQHIMAVWSFVRDNLVPIILKLWQVGTQAFNAIAKVLRDNEPELRRILKAVWTLVDALGQILLWLATKIVIPILKPLFTTVLPVALGFTIDALDFVAKAVIGVRDGFVWLRDNAGKAIDRVWDKIKGPVGAITDAFEGFAGFVADIVDGLKWLIDNAKSVGGFFSGIAGKIPGVGGPSIFDKLRAEQTWASSAASGVSRELWDEIGLGKSMGLVLSSGFRPGDLDSKHGYGKAIDMAGPAGSMLAFARSVVGRPGIDEVFYDPLGYSMDQGRVVPWTLGDHFDHVHVGIFDKGGFLNPGWNLAYNGLGRPEPVGGGNVYITVQGSVVTERELFGIVKREASRFKRLNGNTGLA